MASTDTRQPRLAATIFLIGLMVLLGVVLRIPEGPLGGELVRSSYDSLHQFRGAFGEIQNDSPVVIIYLDLNSFGLMDQDPTQPWSRRLHAQLLRKLTRSGAKAVVFDIVFTTPGADASVDKSFAAAIQDSRNTFLAGEASGKNSHKTDDNSVWTRLSTVAPPLQSFADVAAGWGIAAHIMDDDYVVRRYVAGGFGGDAQPSLTWAVAAWLKLPLTQQPDAMARANGSILRYYGPPLTIPHVSYAEAMATDGTPDNFFRDKIVFIGARPLTEFFRGRQDEFRSPFHSWDNKELFHPGVEVHATEMLNLIRADGLLRTSSKVEALGLLLAALAFGGCLMRLRPLRAAVVALVGGVVVFGIANVLFAREIWFPW